MPWARSNDKGDKGSSQLFPPPSSVHQTSPGLEHRTMWHAGDQVAGTRSEAIPQAGLTSILCEPPMQRVKPEHHGQVRDEHERTCNRVREIWGLSRIPGCGADDSQESPYNYLLELLSTPPLTLITSSTLSSHTTTCNGEGLWEVLHSNQIAASRKIKRATHQRKAILRSCHRVHQFKVHPLPGIAVNNLRRKRLTAGSCSSNLSRPHL